MRIDSRQRMARIFPPSLPEVGESIAVDEFRKGHRLPAFLLGVSKQLFEPVQANRVLTDLRHEPEATAPDNATVHSRGSVVSIGGLAELFEVHDVPLSVSALKNPPRGNPPIDLATLYGVVVAEVRHRESKTDLQLIVELLF